MNIYIAGNVYGAFFVSHISNACASLYDVKHNCEQNVISKKKQCVSKAMRAPVYITLNAIDNRMSLASKSRVSC